MIRARAWMDLVAGALSCVLLAAALPAAAADAPDTVARVKRSIVAVGTFLPTRAPAFQFRATGFVLGDGTLVATNAHAVPAVLEVQRKETLAVAISENGESRVRSAVKLAVDPDHDLLLLRLTGPPMTPLAIADSNRVKEGETYLFTGYPLGTALGLYPATHRAMVAAVTPIAIPQSDAGRLDPRVIRRLATNPFRVFQLDATAYPGNSGSPLYDAASGEVVGVLNMVFVKGTKETAITAPSGITYAIPARHLVELLAKAR
jgi:S1-C subfamily serine protease